MEKVQSYSSQKAKNNWSPVEEELNSDTDDEIEQINFGEIEQESAPIINIRREEKNQPNRMMGKRLLPPQKCRSPSILSRKKAKVPDHWARCPLRNSAPVRNLQNPVANTLLSCSTSLSWLPVNQNGIF